MTMFNIRVYGILQNEKGDVLVSDEFIRGNQYTKFPGGGLEFGEGTRDCLRREFLEEMQLNVLVTDHIYTTDFFQMSAFNPEHQIISIYYRVEALEDIRVPQHKEGTRLRIWNQLDRGFENGNAGAFATGPGRPSLNLRPSWPSSGFALL